MGLTWTDDPKPDGNGEHPIVALIAVAAILLAILLIAWARIEVRGTQDLEAALAEVRADEDAPAPPSAPAQTEEERIVDEAVTSSRFATGFSP